MRYKCDTQVLEIEKSNFPRLGVDNGPEEVDGDSDGNGDDNYVGDESNFDMDKIVIKNNSSN